MRILAIESSGRDSSIAALEGRGDTAELLESSSITGPARTAGALAPAIRDLLAAIGWKPADVQLVAVTTGPGSFTGLRIGVTAAKSLAYAVGAEVIGINTLEILAVQVPASDRSRNVVAGLLTETLWTILDAGRQELFAAKFRCGRSPVVDPPWRDRATPSAGSGDPRTTEFSSRHSPSAEGLSRDVDAPTHIIPQADFLTQLHPGDLITGPATAKLQSHLPHDVQTTNPTTWPPTATTLGHLAWRAYQKGHRDDLWKLTPQYYRLSAAEEKRAKESRDWNRKA